MSGTERGEGYPWEGGDYWATDVRVFAEGEPDEEGEPLSRPMIGLGDYVDEGAPDLCVSFAPGTDPEHVQWVADALAAALAEHEGCISATEHAEVMDLARDLYVEQIAALRTEREEAVRLLRAITDHTLRECEAAPGWESWCQCRSHQAVRLISADVAAFLARTDTGGQE